MLRKGLFRKEESWNKWWTTCGGNKSWYHENPNAESSWSNEGRVCEESLSQINNRYLFIYLP